MYYTELVAPVEKKLLSSEDISKDIDAFLSKGGEIKKIPIGVVSIDQAAKVTRKKNKAFFNAGINPKR